MTATHNIEAQQAIHQAATKLAALEIIDQAIATIRQAKEEGDE